MRAQIERSGREEVEINSMENIEIALTLQSRGNSNEVRERIGFN